MQNPFNEECPHVPVDLDSEKISVPRDYVDALNDLLAMVVRAWMQDHGTDYAPQDFQDLFDAGRKLGLIKDEDIYSGDIPARFN